MKTKKSSKRRWRRGRSRPKKKYHIPWQYFEQIHQLPWKDVLAKLGITLVRKNGKISCPYHDEKSPSLSFVGYGFKCFGCHSHGDAFQFVMRYKRISPPGAMKFFKRHFGIKPFTPEAL